MKTRSIVITAAGTGKRMGSDIPKQFLLLAGKPVLMHTIELLYRYSPESQLVLTLPEDHMEDWKALCRAHDFKVELEIVPGGKERYHSIRRALEKCTGELIAVHDGVRPLVSEETLDRLFEAAEMQTAVVPVVQVKDSLRRTDSGGSHAVPRSEYRIVQTPQVFDADVLRKAYALPFDDSLTDDASLVERSGELVFLVDGNDENIKITMPSDLTLAESLVRKRTENS